MMTSNRSAHPATAPPAPATRTPEGVGEHLGEHLAAQQSPAWAMATALARWEKVRRASELKSRLGTADRRIMWLFADRRPRTLREIADALGLEQSTVNRQVNAALTEGLLVRFREPGQSARLVTVTDEGLERFSQDLSLHLGLFEQALGQLSAEDQTRMIESLETFVAHYGEAVARL